MEITTKELRLNLASILQQAANGQTININYGRGSSKQTFQITKQIDPNEAKKIIIAKLFEKIENSELSSKAKKLQHLSQKEFQKVIKNMYEEK
jgi:uncharacterized membrane protein YukC